MSKLQKCKYCLGYYDYPVMYHHTETECDRNQRIARIVWENMDKPEGECPPDFDDLTAIKDLIVLVSDEITKELKEKTT